MQSRQAGDRVVDSLRCGPSAHPREEVAGDEAGLLARLDATSDGSPEVLEQKSRYAGRGGDAQPAFGLFEVEGEVAALVANDSPQQV